MGSIEILSAQVSSKSYWKRLQLPSNKETIVPSGNGKFVDVVQDLESDLRHLLIFGKLIGLYPSSKIWLMRIVTAILCVVTLVDWIGMFLEPPTTGFRTAADMCGRIGSPQFYTIGTFCYIYIQSSRKPLKNFYERWKHLPVIEEDKYYKRFVNTISVAIMTSAILENISFHFKLFPVFEPAEGNLTSFEVYYQRSHHFWATTVPFTPFQAVILLITNKLALYAWNFSDIFATVLCRALRHQFDSLNRNIELLGPEKAVQRHEDLIELMRMLEKFLSPLVFSCFYEDFYATCMQLHMWMTPKEHKHFLHTIYLLWSFIHLIVRVFLLSYQASSLHETSIQIQGLLRLASLKSCSQNTIRKVSRIDYSHKRQLAISGLGCFFITKRFLLTLIYVAFSFQIFLMQSDSLSLQCP